MTIDNKFVGQMLTKYSRHLDRVVVFIEKSLEDYDRQLASLRKLDQMKYGSTILELEHKKEEAFKKLADITPNINKMREYIPQLLK